MSRYKFFLILLLFFLSTPPPAFANPEPAEESNTGFNRSIIIRQERRKIGSVLVIKPVTLDLDILHIINTEGITSLEDYARWLKANVKYCSDNGQDIWSLPEDTLGKRQGDCEDFAFLNAAFLQVMGYQPKVMALVGGIRRVGHAICVIEKGDHYLWFDNDQLKKVAVDSMKEFTRHIFQRYACLGLFEINLDAK